MPEHQTPRPGSRIASTEQQLQAMNSTLESQQQDLQGFKAEVKTSMEQTTTHMQQAMQGFRQDLGTDLDDRFEKLLARMETNAEKRARH